MRIAVRTVKGRQFPRFTGQVLERDRQLVCALPVRSQHVDARSGGLLINRFLFLAMAGTLGWRRVVIPVAEASGLARLLPFSRPAPPLRSPQPRRTFR
jgi:hypothetical protein